MLVVLGDAYCFEKRYKPGEADKGCILRGKLYPFGEISRTDDCYRCSCSREAISCCALYHTPVSYNKEKCKAVFNQESCDYDVVQKDDPSKKCFVYSRVG
uniref:Beta-microseminoprotein-like n=2 Tax=Dromaius novaehollandiae TaxID=8790 RepID=A0A8C4K176_DRONO